MPGCVEEYDLAFWRGDIIRTNMLCNAAGLELGYSCFPNDVQQRGFSMVHMSHDGYDRRSLGKVFWVILNGFK